MAALHPQSAPEPVDRGAVDAGGDAAMAEVVVDWRGLAPALQYLAELLTVEGTLCVECEVLVVQLMGLLVTKAEDRCDNPLPSRGCEGNSTCQQAASWMATTRVVVLRALPSARPCPS